jgi:hypothetical protein
MEVSGKISSQIMASVFYMKIGEEGNSLNFS